jgi:PAS domain S-box-containing protein
MNKLPQQAPTERHLRAQEAVANVLVDASPSSSFVAELVPALGQALGFAVGAAWQPDRFTDTLRPVATWLAGELSPQADRLARSERLARGSGLAGQAWAQGEVAWTEATATEPSFADPGAAAGLGLAGGVAFPIANETELLAVIDFFDAAIGRHDVELVSTLAAVSRKVGYFAQRSAVIRALEASEAQLKAIIDTTPAIIYVKRAGDFRYTLVNREFEQRFGLEPGQAIGKYDEDLLPAEAVERDRRVVETGEPTSEIESTELAGERRWYLSLKFPLTGEDGRPYAVCGISTDVTERQRAEAERVRKEAAERANVAKSDFLSRMSHELRTPMNAVLGFAQLLESDDLGPDQRESVAHILVAGRHLLELIDEVLDISRIEVGELRISLEPVQVETVVEEVVALVRPLAQERGVTLEIDPAVRGERYVKADRQRLRQVLINLVSNAIKYGGSDHTVTVSARSAAADRLELLVADTGPGIPKDRLEQLFLPFERLGAELGSVPGTGLGLALSKSLVDAMGGGVRVHSEIGAGTTFAVDLERTEPAPESEAPAARDIVLPPTATGSVLYVEDNPSNVELVRRALARLPGATLVTTAYGDEAVELARSERPGAILLDLDLPDVGGTEVLRRLRADARTADVPVVVVTANVNARERKELLALGAHAYVTKPFDVAALTETIAGLLA